MDWQGDDIAWEERGDPLVAPDPGPTAPRERRLQVRAYNYWANMLGRRRFPAVADLSRGDLRDLGPRSVLLDFSNGTGEPGIAYLGDELVRASGAPSTLGALREAPAGSLLARLDAHHQPVITTGSPTGFGSAYVDEQGRTVLYRGIMLPFSTDDQRIDYVLAVVSWKELAVGPAGELDPGRAARRAPRVATALADWADGPGSDDAVHACPPANDDPLGNSGAGDPGAGTGALPPGLLDGLAPIGPEYALLLVRRTPVGPELVSEVPHDPLLLAAASSRLRP